MNTNFTKITFLLFIFCLASHWGHGQSWQVLGTAGLSAGETYFSHIAINRQGTPYIAYQDGGNGYKATVKKYNGVNWENVGLPGFSSAWAQVTKLAFDANGTPLIAFTDQAKGDKATVKRFNGSSWIDVGNPGFSPGIAMDISFAIDAAGTPYVAYVDMNNNLKATVMKYTGASWVIVGGTTLSVGPANYTSLALDANGMPVVAYQDELNANKATVKRFNGNSWVDVGVAGISAGRADWVQLALDASGNPFVAYRDAANGDKITVRKYKENAWSDVGTPGFAGWSAFSGWYEPLSLAVDPEGSPLVAYQDGASVSKVTVRKFVGNSWDIVGRAGISAGMASYISLALAADGTPHVAYQDGGNGNKATAMKFAVPLINITSQPQASTIEGGQHTAFTVATAGSEATYQWQVSRDGGASFSDLSNGPVYSGATSTSLTLSSVPISMSGYRYRVRINDDVLISNVVSLTVRVPAFDTGRNWQKACAGDASNFPATSAFIAKGTDGAIYAAYRDESNAYKATVKKLIGGHWQLLGTAGFSPGPVSSPSLAFDANGTPFLAYADGGNGDKATVMKFNGSNWVPVGPAAGFSAGGALYTSLALDPNGAPVVAYLDRANGSRATVMKYTGAGWNLVGPAGFSAGVVTHTSLALDPGGIPYLGYVDETGRAFIRKYTGTAWADVGASGFATGESGSFSLALDNNSTPYVGFGEEENEGKGKVKKYNGSSWVDLGSAGFSAGQAGQVNLVVDAGGIPFVAYQDETSAGAVTVKRYNGSSWETIGLSAFLNGETGVASLALDGFGTPYVAFLEAGNENKATVIKFAAGPDIQTGTLSATTYCAGRTVQVPFTVSHSLEANHVFTAQLSDASGSFAAPISIGSSTVSPIAAVIPAQVAPGSGYRIRVMSLSPLLIGADNGLDLSVGSASALPGAITGPPAICPEETGITYSVAPVPGVRDYTWTLPSDWRIISGQGSASIVVATAGSGGQVKVFTSNDCGQSAVSTLAVAVTFPVGGNLLVENQDQSLCWGGTAQVLVGPALTRDNSTITYLWEYSTSGPATGFAPAPGLNSAKDYAPVAGLTSSTWFRRRVMPGSCLAAASYSNTIQVSVAARLTPPAAIAGSRCGPGTLALSASGTVPNGSYRWYTSAGGGEAIAGATQATFLTPILSSTTTYYVSAVSPQGCESERTAVVAAVHPVPTANAGENMSSCINQGAFILSDFSPAGGTWSGPGVTATGVFTPATAGLGSHTLSYEVTLNGCKASATKTITVNPVPSLELAAYTRSICSNTTGMVLSEGVPAGGTWSGPGVNNNIFNASLAGIGTHALVYTYSDAKGCQATASRAITVVGCTYFKEDESVSRLVLYPNPAVSELKVSLLLKSNTPLTYRVFSRDGKLVLEKSFGGVGGDFSHVFDLRAYAKGLYLLQQITNSGVVNKSFVLQ